MEQARQWLPVLVQNIMLNHLGKGLFCILHLNAELMDDILILKHIFANDIRPLS